MKDVTYKCITFSDGESSHFFYDSHLDSDYGNVIGVKGLTLPKAIAIIKHKGKDVTKNIKTNISCYYHH